VSLLQRLCEAAEGQAAEAAAAEAAATASLVSLGVRGPRLAAVGAAAAMVAAAADEHARCVDVEPVDAMEVKGEALGTASGAAVTPMVIDAAMGSGAPCDQDQSRGAPPTPATSTPTPLDEHFFSALTKLLDAHALLCVQRRLARPNRP
jgi:hypothetical protein